MASADAQAVGSAPARSGHPSVAPVERRRILIIDDTPEIHADFRRILLSDPAEDEFQRQAAALFASPPPAANEGPKLEYDLSSAHQGREALEMVKQALEDDDPYWMMFVDMRMPPGWDGLTTIRKIWEIAPDIQAVICTAYSDHTWTEMVQALGTTDRLLFIHKPFSHLEIQQAALTLTTKWKINEENKHHVQELRTIISRLEQEGERRSQAEQLAEFNAEHDPLTQLPNRLHFIDLVERRLAALGDDQDSKLAVATIDIDGFKVIVNGLPTDRVDALIRRVARVLQDSVGDKDIVARSGGDRFLVCLGEVESSEAASEVVESLTSSLHTAFEGVTQRSVRLSASAGLTMMAPDQGNSNDWLAHAELALNTAKASGRGKVVVFDDTLQYRATQRLELEEELGLAIENEEITVNYQPIVDLASGQIVGFEALSRWQHPKRGFVSPVEFIPIAEESGLIVQLGQLALRKACRTLAKFNVAAGRSLTMSVNVSPAQLLTESFVEDYRRVLTQAGCPGTVMKLEITESGVMGDPQRAARLLTELRGLGTEIYVDDFGTGYSSLSHLQRLPVDALKIDRCFVGNLQESDDDRAIVTAIITLAHALGLSVVAEGIETADQLAVLRSLGCEFGQGYLFSRPLPADEIATLLTTAPTW